MVCRGLGFMGGEEERVNRMPMLGVGDIELI